jgi:hypothetical protein
MAGRTTVAVAKAIAIAAKGLADRFTPMVRL